MERDFIDDTLYHLLHSPCTSEWPLTASTQGSLFVGAAQLCVGADVIPVPPPAPLAPLWVMTSSGPWSARSLPRRRDGIEEAHSLLDYFGLDVSLERLSASGREGFVFFFFSGRTGRFFMLLKMRAFLE